MWIALSVTINMMYSFWLIVRNVVAFAVESTTCNYISFVFNQVWPKQGKTTHHLVDIYSVYGCLE